MENLYYNNTWSKREISEDWDGSAKKRSILKHLWLLPLLRYSVAY
jgi:hypothetical protein